MAKFLLCIIPWLNILYGMTAYGDIDLSYAERIRTTSEMTSNSRQDQPRCWIFTHLQKNGGSSVKHILSHRCNYCRSRVYDHGQWYNHRSGFTDDFGENKRYNVMMGGYTEALRLQDPSVNACLWFTMFRHPISRVVSAFFHCKRNPSDRCCGTPNMPPEAHNDIVAFAKHWGNFAVRQFAMGFIPAEDVFESIREKGEGFRYASGWYMLKVYLEENAADTSNSLEDDVMLHMLKPIQNLLSEKFAAVGILEEFNTTISLFDAALGIPGLDWQKAFSFSGMKNVDEAYKREEEKLLAQSWLNSELKSYMHLDLLLYEHAVDVFHQQARYHNVI